MDAKRTVCDGLMRFALQLLHDDVGVKANYFQYAYTDRKDQQEMTKQRKDGNGRGSFRKQGSTTQSLTARDFLNDLTVRRKRATDTEALPAVMVVPVRRDVITCVVPGSGGGGVTGGGGVSLGGGGAGGGGIGTGGACGGGDDQDALPGGETRVIKSMQTKRCSVVNPWPFQENLPSFFASQWFGRAGVHDIGGTSVAVLPSYGGVKKVSSSFSGDKRLVSLFENDGGVSGDRNKAVRKDLPVLRKRDGKSGRDVGDKGLFLFDPDEHKRLSNEAVEEAAKAEDAKWRSKGKRADPLIDNFNHDYVDQQAVEEELEKYADASEKADEEAEEEGEAAELLRHIMAQLGACSTAKGGGGVKNQGENNDEELAGDTDLANVLAILKQLGNNWDVTKILTSPQEYLQAHLDVCKDILRGRQASGQLVLSMAKANTALAVNAEAERATTKSTRQVPAEAAAAKMANIRRTRELLDTTLNDEYQQAVKMTEGGFNEDISTMSFLIGNGNLQRSSGCNDKDNGEDISALLSTLEDMDNELMGEGKDGKEGRPDKKRPKLQ